MNWRSGVAIDTTVQVYYTDILTASSYKVTDVLIKKKKYEFRMTENKRQTCTKAIPYRFSNVLQILQNVYNQ
jgi:hypothetical protein